MGFSLFAANSSLRLTHSFSFLREIHSRAAKEPLFRCPSKPLQTQRKTEGNKGMFFVTVKVLNLVGIKATGAPSAQPLLTVFRLLRPLLVRFHFRARSRLIGPGLQKS